MKRDETRLLYRALCYEEGHPRRTQHILKVYALAKLLGEQEGLSPEERQILQAAAILHDIAIKYCKDRGMDAGQENQRQAAPALVRRFLEEAEYPESDFPEVLDLVLRHHRYDQPRGRLLQLLMEADLIVNCYECPPSEAGKESVRRLFKTVGGKELLSLCLNQT